MYFQKVLKGIPNISGRIADLIVTDSGILCSFWQHIGPVTPSLGKELLTEKNLYHHLDDYDLPLPSVHPYHDPSRALTYGAVTPFISTTAGTIERDPHSGTNNPFPAFLTALDFATRGFTTTGFIFYAYVLTLGKMAVPLHQFAEETRELHIYRDFQIYHHEGEVMAKIHIPSVQIKRAEYYDGPFILARTGHPDAFKPTGIIHNLSYTPPEEYSNVREYI
jgi:hypothetical protein